MDNLSFLLCLMFCAGILLVALPERNRLRLKERAKKYLENAAVKTGLKKRAKGSRKKTSVYVFSMNRELSEALSYTKNVVILGRGKSMSAQLLCEELASVCNMLKPAFEDMAGYLHINNKEDAARCLYNAMGTEYASDLGRFLSEWENVPSKELLQTVEIYRDSIREQIETASIRRDEMISDIIYFPVVINCMAVLVNFVYVGFFLEQQELLQYMF